MKAEGVFRCFYRFIISQLLAAIDTHAIVCTTMLPMTGGKERQNFLDSRDSGFWEAKEKKKKRVWEAQR